jgi:hypothetical protein
MFADDRNIRRVFQEMFCVQDIAEALPSFDDTTDGDHVKRVMVAKGLDVVGVRQNGIVTGYVEQSDLHSGCCREVTRPLADANVVADTLPLASLILHLKDQPRLFVLGFGQVSGVVNRGDIQKPPGRMWLFGMITLLEMRFSRMIEQWCPNDSWETYLSEGRLEKAQQLLAYRRGRNQQLSLADCLQLADKISIIARNTQLRSLTRFHSKRETEEIGKQLENLRNSLAHSQDIVANDWETIVALAEQLDSVLNGPPGIIAGEPHTGNAGNDGGQSP